VCVGYYMGARFALRSLATRPDEFLAGAAIHPGPLLTDAPDSPHHELDQVRGELYLSFADNDPSAPADLVERLREEVARKGVRGTVEIASGAAHGFSMADLPVYDRDASERHFDQTLALWRRNLSGQSAGAAG